MENKDDIFGWTDEQWRAFFDACDFGSEGSGDYWNEENDTKKLRENYEETTKTVR
jgi:hypothetical protein